MIELAQQSTDIKLLREPKVGSHPPLSIKKLHVIIQHLVGEWGNQLERPGDGK